MLMGLADEPLGASPLTLAEVMVGPARAGRIDRAISALEDLGVSAVPLPDDAPARLAVLRAATGLELPDCCVLLAAEQGRSELASFDHRLATVANGRGLAVRQG